MTPLLLTCTCLLLPCCVPITLSTSELEFYRDGIPETPEAIALRELARYLEVQEHRERSAVAQRSRLSPLLVSPPRKKYHQDLARQKERDLFEALAGKAKLADILRKEKEKLEAWNYQRRPSNDIAEDTAAGKDYDLPYYEQNPLNRRVEGFGRNFDPPPPKFPYFPPSGSGKGSFTFEDANFEYRAESPSSRHGLYHRFGPEKGTKEQPFHGYRQFGNYGNAPKDEVRKPQVPSTAEFTFRFDDSNLGEKHPFAVKPNDPRYYRDSAFFSDDSESNTKGTSTINAKWEGARDVADKEEADEKNENGENVADSGMRGKFKDSSMAVLPDPERRTGYHPLVVPVNHDLNNDIYFIAIVAGCSAAAMFALVLIGLTWCRLQRGVKAAADIEYPAYGVTGPNKDVSPSGDQRLAQSAQMYHFQHQKQQIIAMENRASASRDPGSVSEAESDEENEEGDYTVYECPGLASTGEMEVKNPLFHDDPTPATPARSTKEEDHV